jgi:hypothetical protein
MTIHKSFEQRAREEVERIKREERAEEERRQKRMEELRVESDKRREAKAAEERRREARRAQEQAERERVEDERMKAGVFRSWTANGGSAAEFEDAWPGIKADLLKQRTIEQETRSREEMRISSHSRI